RSLKYLLKITASAAAIIMPFIVGSYFLLLAILRQNDSLENLLMVLKYFLPVILFITYMVFTSFASAHNNSWKKFLKSWVLITFRKISHTSKVFLAMSAALMLSSLILYGAVWFGRSALLLLFAGLLFIITITAAKIFWISCVYELEENENSRSPKKAGNISTK
ncbi:MAG: hypothetical protein AABX05_01935, partial [Nanoarchaeota archaeon]